MVRLNELLLLRCKDMKKDYYLQIFYCAKIVHFIKCRLNTLQEVNYLVPILWFSFFIGAFLVQAPS